MYNLEFKLNRQYQILLGFTLSLGFVFNSLADQVNVAVASNALAAIKVISSAFEKKSGHTVVVSSGSTGKLYAQIVNGAPFDVFLAANEREPKKLEQNNLIVPNSRFTYALGKLVVWSANASLLKTNDIRKILNSKSVNRIAIANPKIAPYGLAALQVLQKLEIWDSLQAKIIRGENVSQTYQFAVTNNAQIGFVAKSQIQGKAKGSYWEVPQEMYAPIRQQGVLLLRSQRRQAALEYVDFLKSDSAIEILSKQFGYGIESSGEI
ncbi:molybdate ABC transporter substrate-binding protein [Kaarinaea lacus]